jgi:hypothetical protein
MAQTKRTKRQLSKNTTQEMKDWSAQIPRKAGMNSCTAEG